MKKPLALAAAAIVFSVLGIAAGIVPGLLSLDRTESAGPECANCGVVEAVRIGRLGGTRAAGLNPGSGAAPDARFLITVRMNNGELQTLAQDTTPRFRAGEKVKIENNSLVAGYF